MQLVRDWLLSLVFAALTGALVHLLAPEGATRRSMKIIVSVFLLLSLCQPLARARSVRIRQPEWDAAALSGQAQPLESMALWQAAQALEQTVREILAQELDARQINFSQIAVTTDILDNGSISITQVYISLPASRGADAGMQSEFEERIRAETGLQVRVQLLEE